MGQVRSRRIVQTCIGLLVLSLILTLWPPQSFRNVTITRDHTATPSVELPCARLEGANDTLVVMRTGATEFQDKYPVHMETTIRCYPNYIVFADFEEEYRGEHIIDVLEVVDPEIRNTHPDFELYRRIKQGGRSVLSTSELSGPDSRQVSNGGKPGNPGWKLDKWKFLPMMYRTIQEFPDMKWYMFVETDTYILWATLLKYLGALDPTTPYYLGSQVWVGDIVFAHGGTGFAVSNKAMRQVSEHFIEHQMEWEDFTDEQWAGDAVLGKAFTDSGAPLTYAWPIFQGENPGAVPYEHTDTDNAKRLWCRPTVSYHHLSRDTISDMWNFEQKWLLEQSQDPGHEGFLRHRDVFLQYIMPQMQRPMIDWDNECDEDNGLVESLPDCEAICEKTPSCIQYQVDIYGTCKISNDPKLGEARPGVRSGWIIDRVQQFADSQEPCPDEEGWIT